MFNERDHLCINHNFIDKANNSTRVGIEPQAQKYGGYMTAQSLLNLLKFI